MDFHTINPGHFRLPMLLKLGVEDIHELARKAVAVLTTYRLVVGRCLLAMHESKGFKRHGCASAIHYACAVLGMSAPSARECRRVARLLQDLPALTLAAEHGTVEWSKLREIVRRAVPETEEYWLRLAQNHSYREIEVLVSRTPTGSLPGEIDNGGDSYRSELRCAAGPRLFAMLERVRRVTSEEREEAMTTAEVLEMVLASFMAGGSFEPDALEKAQESVDKDLLAEEARRLPVVVEARELAVEMGLLEAELVEPQGCDEEENHDEPEGWEIPESAERIAKPESAELTESADCNVKLERAVNAEPAGCEVKPERAENAERENEVSYGASVRMSEGDEDGAKCSARNTFARVPSLNSWKNRRLRFNRRSRFVTRAQREELLRRDGWACRTPGCPNRCWLHLHHRHEYSKGGSTLPENLLCLCSGCHRNVHDGILNITETPSGELLYTNAQGERLDRQADLHLATWLDFHLGWSGNELDSHQARIWKGDWAVFAS